MRIRSSPEANLLRRTVRFLSRPIAPAGSGEEDGRSEELRRKALLECSRVVEEMPRELLQLLTDKAGPTTPQESFLNHFERAVPRYDFEVFRLRFAEIFCSLGGGRLADVGRAGPAEFWSRFEVLFGGMPGSGGKTRFFSGNGGPLRLLRRIGRVST